MRILCVIGENRKTLTLARPMIYLQFNIIEPLHWKLSCMAHESNIPEHLRFASDDEAFHIFHDDSSSSLFFFVLIHFVDSSMLLGCCEISHWFNDWKIAIVHGNNKSRCSQWSPAATSFDDRSKVDERRRIFAIKKNAFRILQIC